MRDLPSRGAQDRLVSGAQDRLVSGARGLGSPNTCFFLKRKADPAHRSASGAKEEKKKQKQKNIFALQAPASETEPSSRPHAASPRLARPHARTNETKRFPGWGSQAQTPLGTGLAIFFGTLSKKKVRYHGTGLVQRFIYSKYWPNTGRNPWH